MTYPAIHVQFQLSLCHGLLNPLGVTCVSRLLGASNAVVHETADLVPSPTCQRMRVMRPAGLVLPHLYFGIGHEVDGARGQNVVGGAAAAAPAARFD